MSEHSMGIPNCANWEELSFGELCQTLSRGTAPSYVAHSSVRAIGQRCVQNAGFDATQARSHDPRVTGVLWAQPGDVLLNSTGTGTIGRSCIFEHPGSFMVDGHVTVLRAERSKVDPRWLNLALRSSWGQRHLESHCYTGSTNQIELSRTELTRSSVPVPVLEEQRGIAEILDTVDEHISTLATILEKRKRVRSGILADLIDPHRMHRVARLGDVGRISSGSTPSRGRSDYWGNGAIPWVKTAEVAFSVLNETAEHVTASAVRDCRLTVYPAGTVLVAMYGEGVTRGRSAILGVPATVNQACAAISPDSETLNSGYLFECLRHLYGEIRLLGHGSNQMNLNADLLGGLGIPVPSMEDQDKMVAVMQDFDSESSAIDDTLSKVRAMKQGLSEDLLTGRVRVPEAEAVVGSL